MTNFPPLDERTRSVATDTEYRYLEAVHRMGTFRAVEAAFDLSDRVVCRAIRRLERRLAQLDARAARQSNLNPPGQDGFVVASVSTEFDKDGKKLSEWRREEPEPTTAPGGEDAGPARDGTDEYVISGVSTLYGPDGSTKAQWVKTKLDDQRRREAIEIAARTLAETLPRVDPVPFPTLVREELANLYTFTDSHVGMLAWHREGGHNWNLSIAEATLVSCFEQMVISSPVARTAIVNQLGDFLHFDSLQAITPTHGHILDADSRFSKMVAVSIRILRRIIDLALSRHEHVYVILAEGNHDMASSVWLRHLFASLYEREPRVTINNSELPYYVHQHGKTMLAFHHGHIAKNEKLPLLFAAQYPLIWGATSKRYCNVGHRHHRDEKEHAGMLVIQHPTLAPRDAHAARGGWISEREATVLTFHTSHGLVARTTVTPEMLEPS